MKRIHTEKKSANRVSGFTSRGESGAQSLARRAKRASLQPTPKRHIGLSVRRTQTITLERYNGVRRKITKTIEHYYGSFDRT